MINLLELLFNQYHENSRLCITWDAAAKREAEASFAAHTLPQGTTFPPSWHRRAAEAVSHGPWLGAQNREVIVAPAIGLKKEQPFRSPAAINGILKQEFGRMIPRSHDDARHLAKRVPHAGT